MTVKEAAEKWGLSDRRVRMLCKQGEIEGIIQKGRAYLIPVDAIRPADGRSPCHKTISKDVADIIVKIDAKNFIL